MIKITDFLEAAESHKVFSPGTTLERTRTE